MIIQFIQCVLLAFFAIAAARLVATDNLFSAALITSIVSLLAAAMYLILNSPDVAFTEAAVGAGVSTILFLSAVAATRQHYAYSATRKAGGVLVTSITGAAIYYSMLHLPLLGSEIAPAHMHVSDYYIANTMLDIGIPNLVTAVLASYRGFDTLGEISVIFTAGVGVLVILSSMEENA